MKNLLFLCTAALVLGLGRIDSANAQTADQVAFEGHFGNESPPSQTTLAVEFVIEKQEITAGPYARYAQKYLGVTAPLADKVIHHIKSAKIITHTELQAHNNPAEQQPNHHLTDRHPAHTNPPHHSTPRLAIDKMSSTQQSADESAKHAAEQLFRIRKSRLDIITGDAGENVFGAGLKDALQELDRLEEEYTALFLGHQTTTTATKRYHTTPAQGAQKATVCRFSESEGTVPEDDMSGAPVVLELKKTGDISADKLGLTPVKKPNKKSVAYRIAANVHCRLIFEGKELITTEMPLLQLGDRVYTATPLQLPSEVQKEQQEPQ